MDDPEPQVQDVPASNLPPAPVQAGQQAQQQQQQQFHLAPPTHAPAPQQPAQQIVHLNWSHCKPEFSGKHDDNAEAHSSTPMTG